MAMETLTLTAKQPYAELICLGIMDCYQINYLDKIIGKQIFIHASTNDKHYTPTEEQFAATEHIEEFNFDNNAIIGMATVDRIEVGPESIWRNNEEKQHFVFKNAVLFEKPIRNVKGKGIIWKYQHTL